jgi:archaellum component FlaF (FlaF/FlaG flagellin family)
VSWGRGRWLAAVIVLVVASTAAAPGAGAATPTTGRLSVTTGSPGTQANDDSLSVAVSRTGRFTSFSSHATNLVAGDTDNAEDVFLRDTTANTTRRVSVATGSPGAQGACEPGRPKCQGAHFSSISADGRYVAFESDFANLVPGDTNNQPDIFVRDTVANTTVRVSVTSSEAQTNPMGSTPSLTAISANGRKVAFISNAKEYANETVGSYDAFVRDLDAGTTTLVSVTTAGGPVGSLDQGVTRVRLSPDGNFVAFHATGSQFVTGDTNGKRDVFVRDLVNRRTTRVSLTSTGAQANGDSYLDSVGTNGAAVGFSSQATNMVPGDTNAKEDAFVRRSGTTIRVDVSSAGAQANNQSICSRVSDDGRYVAFCSQASNLVAGDTNGKVDTFWRDTQLGTTVRVSVSTTGAQGNNLSPWPAISGDGKFVSFESDATNLVGGDTNAKRDVFLRGPLV